MHVPSMTKYRLYDLRDVGMEDVADVGGKAAALGEMMRAGLPVPAGFVIPVSVFRWLLAEKGLIEDIEQRLRTMVVPNAASLAECSVFVSEQIRTLVFPNALREVLCNGYARLGAEQVAVRSSAAAEDSRSAAWAGQLESFLSVREEELVEAIKACWMSAFRPRALLYRYEQGRMEGWAEVAVVIQEMVASERSGVAFSVHPVTQRHDHLVIEAVRGLGDALVSGVVTPDTYVVQRVSMELVEQRLSGRVPVLTPEERTSLARLVLRAEAVFGYPVDCEWVSRHGNVWLVQCRPITTLGALSAPRTPFRLESIIRDEGLVCIGSRPTDYFGAQRRALGWTRALREELGVGYSVMLVNSLGELYVQPEEDEAVRERVSRTSLHVGLMYLQNMEALRDELLGSPADPMNSELCTGLERMFAYFFLAREILERTFAQASAEEQKRIIAWRETDQIYEVIDRLPRVENEPAAWTVIVNREGLSVLPMLITEDQSSVELSTSIVKGQVAYPGYAVGQVRLVRSLHDCAFVQPGEIVVATMTMPDHLPALQRAAAYVTDEGGITSHAAITARELRKPCVIATKIATKVLRTGDEVEVDAERGVVRRLSK